MKWLNPLTWLGTGFKAALALVAVLGLMTICCLGVLWILIPTAPEAVAQPQYAQPQYAQPQYAQPQYAQPQYAQPQYACSAYEVGAPVKVAGSCSFCTINYSKPGVVYIVGATPMSYSAGAFVWQYNADTSPYQGFESCILDQSFIPDPAYTEDWRP